MKKANIADFKNHFSKFIFYLENGEDVEIHRRNIPIARVIAIHKKKKNSTILGYGKGSVRVNSDLTQPLIPLKDCEIALER